ncbi:CTP synthase C-terminal region-related (seleno)protein [Sphaerisporangium viridialbum]|uniref:CTP synthase C-terminal region-related (seleno)protein n=1 Tax=Sphaerisporangium viridialbum TaxID=46189 RepID=UPI003C77CB31
MTERPRIALIGDRSSKVPAHPRLEALIPHLAAQVDWVPSESISGSEALAGYSGLWVIPGSPYASKDGVLLAVRLARETGIPYLGTCGGFQHALIEYARNVLGLAHADDVQYDPDAETPLITALCCSLAGERSSLHLGDGSRLASVYAHAEQTVETFHCKYGLNPDYVDLIEQSSLVISGWDAEKAPRAIELADHPFFIGTLFQPELSSTPDSVHPLIEAFVAAATRHGETTAPNPPTTLEAAATWKSSS